MPVFAEAQDPLDKQLGVPWPQPWQKPPEVLPSTPEEAAGAAARQFSPIGAMVDNVRNSRPELKPDPGYVPPLGDLIREGYDPYIAEFASDKSEAETTWRKSRIDARMRDLDMVARAGTRGTLDAFIAGSVDPSWAIPVLGEARAGAELGVAARLARGIGEGALRGAGSEAEFAAAGQPRMKNEMLENVGSGAIMMGALGGGVGFLSSAERFNAERTLDKLREEASGLAPTPPQFSPPQMAADLNAAASNTKAMELSPIGIEGMPGVSIPRWMLRASPPGRQWSDPGRSQAGDRAMGEMTETALGFKQSAQGVTSFSGEGPVDALTRLDYDKGMLAQDRAMQENYAKYVGRAGDRFARQKEALGKMAGQSSGKMGWEEFNREVYRATFGGDKHPVPEVEAAAKSLREVFDNVKDMAQATKDKNGQPIFAEDMGPPKGDLSFAPRLYNRPAIERKSNAFDEMNVNWLRSEQQDKAALKDLIGQLNERMAAAEKNGMTSRAAQIRDEIEHHVMQWEGASSKEAQTAVLARMRAQAGGIAAPSADAAVDLAVKRILGWQELSEQELRARANEIRNRIDVGPDGRLPYDGGAAPIDPAYGTPNPLRGSLNARTYAIPSEQLLPYLHTDIATVVASFLRTVLPDIHTTAKFGDVDMTDIFKKVNEHHDALKAKATTEKELARIEKTRRLEIRDLAGQRDRNRNVYGLPSTPLQRDMARYAHMAAQANVSMYLGSSALNRLQDFTNATARRGLLGMFRDAWVPMVQALAGVKVAKAELAQVKAMGLGYTTHLGHLASSYADVLNDQIPGSKFEKGLSRMAELTMLTSGHGPITDVNKIAAGMAASRALLDMSAQVEKGTASAKTVRQLAEAGIAPETAIRISKAFENGGHDVIDGQKVHNLSAWKDKSAARAFEVAVRRDANIAVITPGGEKPFFLSEPIFHILGQFRSFSMAAQERILLSNLQNMDARTLEWFIAMSTMGAASYTAYSLAAGHPLSDNPSQWVAETVKRAAFGGWITDANDIASRMTGGRLNAWRLAGADKPLGRTREDVLEQLGGPFATDINTLATFGKDLSAGKWTNQSSHALRTLVPVIQNNFLLRQGMDQAENNLNEYFGIKPRVFNPELWHQPQ